MLNSGELAAYDLLASHLAVQLSCAGEAGADYVLVAGQGGHGHHTDQLQVRQRLDLLGQVGGGPDRNARTSGARWMYSPAGALAGRD